MRALAAFRVPSRVQPCAPQIRATMTILSPGEFADLMERMLRTSGRRLDISTPFVDVTTSGRSRQHAVIPDIIAGRVAHRPMVSLPPF